MHRGRYRGTVQGTGYGTGTGRHGVQLQGYGYRVWGAVRVWGT